MFIAAEMTAGETVEAIVEELGVRKVVIQGHKTARVEYVVQIIDSNGGEFAFLHFFVVYPADLTL